MLFSIIVPVYNAEKYLERCVDSILSQSFRDFELILVDDGSTDSGGMLCDLYLKKDSRVRVRHKENAGQVSARKTGLSMVSGDYICYVDADDYVTENWLHVIASAIEKGGQPDMIVFGIEELDQEERRIIPCYLEPGYYDRRRMEKEVYPYVICDRRICYTTQLIYPVAWNKAYKKELILSHYCKDLRIRRGEDTAFVYECLLNAKDMYVCGETLYEYNRMNTDSVSAAYGFRLTENDIYLADYLKGHLKGFGYDVERQINDFVVSKIIRSVLWKARTMPSSREAARILKQELKDTGILKKVTLKGLPGMPAAFICALRLRLYFPVMVSAGNRVMKRR